MRQDMLQKDVEIDSLRKKLLQQRKQLNIVCVCVCYVCVVSGVLCSV